MTLIAIQLGCLTGDGAKADPVIKGERGFLTASVFVAIGCRADLPRFGASISKSLIRWPCISSVSASMTLAWPAMVSAQAVEATKSRQVEGGSAR